MNLDEVIRKCNFFEQSEETKKLTGVETDVHTASKSHRGQRSYHKRDSRGRGFGGHFGRGRGQNETQQARTPMFRQGQAARGRGGNNAPRGRGRSYVNSRQYQCQNCGYTHGQRQCPAYGRSCNTCGKIGHFSRMCTNKSVRFNEQMNVTADVENAMFAHDDVNDECCANYYDESAVSESFSELSVSMVVNDQVYMADQEFFVDLLLQDEQSMRFRIDTGAGTSVLSKRAYESIAVKPKLKQTDTAIRGIWESNVPVGNMVLPVYHKGQRFEIECQVVDSNVPNLLSAKDSVRMNLVKRVYHNASDIPPGFNDVFSGVGRIPGEYNLPIDPQTPPVALNARPIPAALREATKNKLDELEAKDIIAKIPVGEPTPWCSALHVVPKKSNNNKMEVRITIDPQHLNKALRREYHPITTIEDVLTRTNGSTVFTCLDANQGYFQIGLDHASQKLTAFNSPFGRYMYKRLPMGITSAPEIYQRAMSEMFQGCEGVEIIMDDILVHGPTVKIHDERLVKVLEICRKNNLKLNPRKTKLRKEEVTYIGHKLTKDGVKIDDEKVQAVLKMPEPTSIHNVQTLLGMVTYTCKFMPNLSAITEPLRNLIKESNMPGFKFYFNDDHRATVRKLKEMMTNAPVLRFYSTTEPIVVSGDASQAGLGAVLLQGGKPVAYASKALTDSQRNYSQLEKEMLAIVFGLKKFHTYVYGRNDVTVETDHLPLVRILDKPLQDVPLRLQKMRMTLQHYSFELVGKSGKEIPVADALSRAYLPTTESMLLQDVNYNVSAREVRGLTAFSDVRREELVKETRNDSELQKVKKVIIAGWPLTKKELDYTVRPYWDSREELAVLDDVVFKGDRVVIPKTMRSYLLKVIHEGHLGMVKCKQLARDILYWPGMNTQIEEMISKCSDCQENRRQQGKEPLMPNAVPSRPWEVVAADLLDCEKSMYLVVTDYYSDYIEVEELQENTHSITVIEKLMKMFATHGKPDKLITDNGPQFRSNIFNDFTQDWRIHHQTTSPHHHQANGKVERANQTIRKLITKSKGNRVKFYTSLLQLRNTPNPEFSPVQKLMSRRTLTKLPTQNKLLQPHTVDSKEVAENIRHRQNKYAKYFNTRATSLQELKEGDTVRVRVQNQWKPAKLIAARTMEPRSYDLKMENGNTWRRNRRDILKTAEPKTIFRPTPEDYEEPQAVKLSPLTTTPHKSPPTPHNCPPIPFNVLSPERMTRDSDPMTPVPHTATKVTRAGRNVKMPVKFKDYLM